MKEQTRAQMDAADCTVVSCRCGKAILCVVTESLDAETKAEIGDLVARGCGVAHMPATEARKADFGHCACAQSQSGAK